jgi:xylose isomerase
MLSRDVYGRPQGARAFSAGDFYPGIGNIKYEGPDSKNPLAFKHYNADEVIMGKTMREHCRFSVVCKSAAAACPPVPPA